MGTANFVNHDDLDRIRAGEQEPRMSEAMRRGVATLADQMRYYVELGAKKEGERMRALMKEKNEGQSQ